MRLVRQNDKRAVKGAPGRGARRARTRAGLAVLAACVVASGCAAADGKKAVEPAPGPQPLQAPPARKLDPYEGKMRAAQAVRVAMAKKWGLSEPPLLAPPAPAEKPVIRARKGFEVDGQEDLPPVFTTVPTKDKVVFLTIDDGSEKDPAFVKMMSDLKIPYTAFLSNYLVKDDYGYFGKMQSRGVSLNNHTLTHPYLPGLSYAGQKREICGMQNIMEEQYGKRPVLFRPPYGNYNRDTLRAAKSCGIKYAPIWNEEVYVDHVEWREADQDLHPGDIVLTHFRGRGEWKGTMPDMVRLLMKYVTDKGYAVARLEDYL
ncbi:polysaccharide deacetylase family protein [Streptomyces sp. AcE210]|uniref:polysaccharide deacetylase family protein n=1 Tax=Streptomyces sp. AcE210 TaxID=2292703 RepID=UPI000E304898|nr:polysaccharide deacetylase family protein [Streptomyces sp. AcE210]RFC74810.1 polysaccharide deacetylase family protein [Streptomyces sp. AcE210]